MSAWTYSQSDGKAASKIVPPRLRIPCWKGLGADSEEKHEPASDIDTVVVDSLKALDPKRPIREADIGGHDRHVRNGPSAQTLAQCTPTAISAFGTPVRTATPHVDQNKVPNNFLVNE